MEEFNQESGVVNEENVNEEVEQVMSEIGEKVNAMSEVSRREFVKILGTTFLAGLFTACGVKTPPSTEVISEPFSPNTPEPLPTQKPLEGTAGEYAEREYSLVKDPKRINKGEFILGDSGFRTAIAENFPFPAIDESGKKYILKYGNENETVTFLHYTGEKPPVTGEIIPILYKLPENFKGKRLEVFPFAISVQGNQSKEIEIDSDGYLLIPIVTSGSNTGIVPNTYEGKLVNSMYPEFKVKPDSVSQNESGYLSWALLRKDGENIVMEGVVNNTSAKIFVDYTKIPPEISDMNK